MGEFEKEVRKRLTILHDTAKNTKSPLGDTVTKIADLSFIPILDKIEDAKKEFPNKTRTFLGTQLPLPPLDVEWCERDVIPILKWFEKWFGDGAENEV